MAQWRSFDASNQTDTCLWCGGKLRLKSHGVYETRHHDNGDRYQELVGREFATRRGDYKDGFFCGLRCAYQFGEAAAKLGFRLSPRVADAP